MVSAGAKALFGIVLLSSAAGCAGAGPLLHPAHTLPKGEISATLGIATSFAVGETNDAIVRAREQAAANPESPGAPGTNPEYAKGAISLATIAPGMAPVIGARAGLGNQFEAGLMYTGRGARLDGRRSFDVSDDVTLSLGVGASSTFYGRQPNTELPNVDLEAIHGFGVDVPVLIGWKSKNDLVMAWCGGRAGLEYDSLEVLSSEPKNVAVVSPIQLTATRVFGGGVVGFATGFRRLHVALELSVYYQSVSGTYNANDVSVSGLSISPASAFIFSF